MFRGMRRSKQEITEAECIQLLKEGKRGVLAVIGEDEYPYAFPMNHIYIDGKLYFHSAKEGYKLDALAANDKVSYCVMDEGFRREGEWSLNIKSVVIFGTIRKLDSTEESMEILRRLGMKHYPTEDSVEEVMKSASARVQMLELTIDYMTGKLVDES